MNTLSLGDRLRLMRVLHGQDLVVSTPRERQALRERGEAEGIPLGTLFCLSRPLVQGGPVRRLSEPAAIPGSITTRRT